MPDSSRMRAAFANAALTALSAAVAAALRSARIFAASGDAPAAREAHNRRSIQALRMGVRMMRGMRRSRTQKPVERRGGLGEGGRFRLHGYFAPHSVLAIARSRRTGGRRHEWRGGFERGGVS